MIQLDVIGEMRDLNLLSVCVRITLAMLFGGTIGFERGLRQRAAGLRTHMLLCVGSASTMLVSQYIYASYGVGDPSRLSAQVLSGIGFLGAGTIIITRRNQIKGLTTAATLWVTACMGLAVGSGFLECAVVMYLAVLIILLVVNVLDNKYLKVETSTAMYLEVKRECGLGDAIQFIHELGWTVREIKEFPSGRPDVLAVRMDLESDQAMREDLEAMKDMKELDSVVRLEM
ncbi:MAG: MgtC/SapB family protein [Ruminiclostridium sp.]|nr:MgtC/SapB family protein [Ruminiclostridium sp.]